jgi:fluoride exporter
MLLFIACGGAFGAVLRYTASSWVYSLLGKGFPYGTLFVNVMGSLLIGLLSVYLLDRAAVSAEWRAAILVGVLGSFTTFSTFSLETLNLLEQGELVTASVNMLASVSICVLAVWFGVAIGRQI